MSDILLDTCAMIWAGNGDSLDKDAVQALDNARVDGSGIFVSAFSAWELGTLVARNRIGLTRPPQEWFADFLSNSGVELAEASPDVLVASSFLPGRPPRDPADRIVIATARARGLSVMTRDKEILEYANLGHVRAIQC